MANFLQLDFQQLDQLDLLARQVVEGFIIGLHKSPYHGFSVEFAEHRLHNTGDSIRDIDWKVYARTEKLYTKRFEEETNLRCQLVIDASSSMYFPKDRKPGELNKMEFSCIAAAAIAYMLKKQRDATGLTVFSDAIQSHTGAKTSALHHQLLLNTLHQLMIHPQEQRTTSTAQALHQIAEAIHKRSLVVIFTDLLDAGDNTDLFQALQHLRHCKHEVILFHVTDAAREMDFTFENRPYEFIDMETGASVKLQPHQVKEAYVKKMQERIAQFRLKCAQYKIDWVEADISEGYRQILISYLLKRSKMM